MRLKNWYNNFVSTGLLMEYRTDMKVKDPYGTEHNCGWYYEVMYYSICPFYGWRNTILSNYSDSGWVFGDGNTAVTIDDYALSGNLISGLTGSVSKNTTIEDGVVKTKFVITLTNGTSDNKTIREVGFMGRAFTQNNSSYSIPVLIERAVLSAPITIEPGGIGQIVYTISVDLPTD